MSAAARAASRSAGRGQALSPRPPPATPVTRLQEKRQPPAPPPGAGRGTPRNASSPAARSALAASVLRRRANPPNTRSRGDRMGIGRAPAPRGDEPHYAGEARGGKPDASARRRGEDWYTSAARREALAGLAEASSGWEATKRPAGDTRAPHPFAWADLGGVVEQLPDGHWARGFVSGVANSVERNDALPGEQKERVLGEVLQVLGQLSREETDERFQDAAG